MYPAAKRAKTAQPQSQRQYELPATDLEVTEPEPIVQRKPTRHRFTTPSQVLPQTPMHAGMHMQRAQYPQQLGTPAENGRSRGRRRRRRSLSETHGPSSQHDIIQLDDNDGNSNGSAEEEEEGAGDGELAAKRPMLMATEPDSQEPPMQQAGPSAGPTGKQEAVPIVLDDDDDDLRAESRQLDSRCSDELPMVKTRSFSCSSSSSSAQLPPPMLLRTRQSSKEAPVWFTPQQQQQQRSAVSPALQPTNQKLKELHMLRQQRRQQQQRQQQQQQQPNKKNA